MELSRRLLNFQEYALEAGYLDADLRVVAEPPATELALVREFVNFLR